MIIDRKNRRLIFLNPKTGTRTLSEVLLNNEGIEGRHRHLDCGQVEALLGNEYLDYKTYGFYRDPVERFVSTFEFVKNGNLPMYTNHTAILYRNKVVDPFINLSITIPELKESIQDLTISEFLNPKDPRIYDCAMESQSGYLLMHQKMYLNHPNITLLDFERFEENCRFLLQEFGLDNTIELQKTNEAINKSSVTGAEAQKIREIYKIDYEFFESRNIKF